MPVPRQLRLNLNFLNAGTFASAWRWPDSDPQAYADIAHYVRVARLAERGTFDSVFLADFVALAERPEYRPYQALEPTIVLASIAAATSHIGLIATASSSYNEPYNIARRFATLDHVSGGRAGINVVTTADRLTARAFGLEAPPSHRRRYDRAIEFTGVLKALWDSWDADAFVGDKASSRFVDTGKIREIDHKGTFFSVAGALSVPRPPQGRPIVVQAGGSADGIDFAARHADAVFSVAHSLPEAATYAAALHHRLGLYGRRPGDVLIFPGLVTVIGATEEEARRRERDLLDLLPMQYGLERLAKLLEIDPARLDLDRPLPDDIPMPEDGMQTFFKTTIGMAGRMSVRELIKAKGGGTNHRILVGTPERIADEMEHWFRSGHVAGFNLMPDVLPSGLEDFVDAVVPLLRRRGIFRADYTGRTLRDHLGLGA